MLWVGTISSSESQVNLHMYGVIVLPRVVDFTSIGSEVHRNRS